MHATCSTAVGVSLPRATPLGGRVGAVPGDRQPLSFAAVLDELRRDPDALTEHPITRDDPLPSPGLTWFPASFDPSRNGR